MQPPSDGRNDVGRKLMVENESHEVARDDEKREFAADLRDDMAAERDVAADTRDEIADEREHLANDREVDQDGRDRQLNGRGQALIATTPHSPEEAASEALQRSNAETLREAAHLQHDDREFEQHAKDDARIKVRKGRGPNE